MAVGSVSFPQPQAYSGGIDWSPLANLGNVYQQAQARQNQLAALAKLGPDPTANATALIQSNDPTLALQGIRMQQQQQTDAESKREFEAQQKLREHLDKRQQEAADQADEDRAASAAALARMFPGQKPPPPSQPDPAFTTSAPPIVPSPVPQPAPPLPSNQGPSVPLAPGQMPPDQAAVPLPQQPALPPSPNAPDQLVATGAMTAQVPVANRAVNSLVSGHPPAAAGLTGADLTSLLRDPNTREIGKTLYQNATAPGTWKIDVNKDTGKVTAVNEKTLESRDITPPSPTGQPPMSKEEREVQGYKQAGLNIGMTEQEANAFAANKGKAPRQDLSATEEKMVEDRTKQIHAGEDVINNIHRLQTLSTTAYSGAGASKRAALLQAVLPDALIPQGAIDTTEYENTALQNVARQAKETFGAKLAVGEVNLLRQIETQPLQSNAARQAILTRLEEMFQRHLKDANDEREAIRNRTFFKPGQQAQPQTTAPQPDPDREKRAAAASDPVEAEMIRRGLK